MNSSSSQLLLLSVDIITAFGIFASDSETFNSGVLQLICKEIISENSKRILMVKISLLTIILYMLMEDAIDW